jgi:hypothetical protein
MTEAPGNETPTTAQLAAWTSAVSAYTKSVDTNHLFQDGSYLSTWGYANLSDPNSDIYTDHLYPCTVTKITTDLTAMSGSNKCFYIGEYDWTPLFGSDSIASLMSEIETHSAICGDCWWSMSMHNTIDQVSLKGTYGLLYPRWTWSTSTPTTDNYDATASITALRNHAYFMAGSSVPTPATPAAPTIFYASAQSGATAAIQWHGSMGAWRYSLERSLTSATSGFVVIADDLSDFQTPFTDALPGGGTAWYRIRAANVNGTFGSYSLVLSVTYSAIMTGSTIYAADLDWMINSLQRQSGQYETGKYVLTGNGYADQSEITQYIATLSRNAVPVSVTIDTVDVTPTGMAAPVAARLTMGGFQVHGYSSGAQGFCQAGGNYAAQY